MTESYYEVDIETWCYYHNDQVIITLRSNKPHKAEVVAGKPVFCNKEFICPHKDKPRCYLKAIRLEARRR